MDNRISRDSSPRVTQSVQPASDSNGQEHPGEERKRRRRRHSAHEEARSAVVELSTSAEPEALQQADALAPAEEPERDAEASEETLDARGRKLDIRA